MILAISQSEKQGLPLNLPLGGIDCEKLEGWGSDLGAAQKWLRGGGVDSPLFSTIVLVKNQPFPQLFLSWFPEKIRIPGKNGNGK